MRVGLRPAAEGLGSRRRNRLVLPANQSTQHPSLHHATTCELLVGYVWKQSAMQRRHSKSTTRAHMEPSEEKEEGTLNLRRHARAERDGRTIDGDVPSPHTLQGMRKPYLSPSAHMHIWGSAEMVFRAHVYFSPPKNNHMVHTLHATHVTHITTYVHSMA